MAARSPRCRGRLSRRRGRSRRRSRCCARRARAAPLGPRGRGGRRRRGRKPAPATAAAAAKSGRSARRTATAPAPRTLRNARRAAATQARLGRAPTQPAGPPLGGRSPRLPSRAPGRGRPPRACARLRARRQRPPRARRAVAGGRERRHRRSRRQPALCRRSVVRTACHGRAGRQRRGRLSACPAARLAGRGARNPADRARGCRTSRNGGARLGALCDGGAIEAHMLRPLDPEGGRIVGLFRRGRGDGRLIPADRRDRSEYLVPAGDAGDAADGDLVVAEAITAGRLGPPRVRIVERLGAAEDPRSVSALVIAAHDIPSEFPQAAVAEAAAARPVDGKGRTDLRDLPLVTIDGSDARDFDDAVWAEPDPEGRGGWHIIVAIADVAWYVRPGSALDREARRRGNSVYFPDRVVPMLPAALSNELCSLKPGEDRACLAVHLWIDAAGNKRRHRFERALMRSAARLTYEQLEAARASGAAAPAPVPHLYGAFRALARAREDRGALDLDIPEYRVFLDPGGRPAAIEPVRRLDSHRLIEEFMILANVAAAEELEALRQPCLYRIHDAPAADKVAALRAL